MRPGRGIALCVAVAGCMWGGVAWCAPSGALPVANAVSSASAEPLPDAGAAVLADLEFETLLAKDDEAKLSAYYQDASHPDALRARALRALFSHRKQTFTADERVRLIAALSDRGMLVRTAAVQVIGASADSTLARQVLQMAENDPNPQVRVAAIRAARPWTKLSHLYFLEGAMNSDVPEVRAEGVRSLGELRFREVPPAIVDRVLGFTRSDQAPAVRAAALETLLSWRRLDWETLRVTLLDPKAPETLRVRAMELTDEVPEASRDRAATLVDIVSREPSLALSWRAFQRVKGIAKGDKVFIQGLSDLLSNTPHRNAATEEIATYLRASGLSVEYQGGGWTVVTRQ